MSKKLKKPSVRTVNHRDGGMSFYAEGGEFDFVRNQSVRPTTNFEQRLYHTPYINNQDGSISSHKMMSWSDENGEHSAPTIVYQNNKLVELTPEEAIDYAYKTGEYKTFNNFQDSLDYGNNGYKYGTPMELFAPNPEFEPNALMGGRNKYSKGGELPMYQTEGQVDLKPRFRQKQTPAKKSAQTTFLESRDKTPINKETVDSVINFVNQQNAQQNTQQNIPVKTETPLYYFNDPAITDAIGRGIQNAQQKQKEREDAMKIAKEEYYNSLKQKPVFTLDMPVLSSDNARIAKQVSGKEKVKPIVYSKDDLEYFERLGIPKKDWYQASKQREYDRIERNAKERQKYLDQLTLDRRQQTYDQAVKDVSKGDYTLARAEALGDTFRLFPNDANSFIDEYLNPFQMVGSMAGNIGSNFASDAQEPFNPFKLALDVASPAVGGRLAALGTKTTGQFLNNALNPLAGTGTFLTTKTPLKNISKLNSFSSRPNLEEIRNAFHNRERYLQPNEAELLNKYGVGIRTNYVPTDNIQYSPEVFRTRENIHTNNLNQLNLNSITRPFNISDVIEDVKPKVRNKSGLTKEEVLEKASSSNKDDISKMSESEFEKTVLKPNGELEEYQNIIENPFVGQNSIYPLSTDDYVEMFNSKLDTLNDIIARNNKSGVEYRVSGLDPNGILLFETPAQTVKQNIPNIKYQELQNLNKLNKSLLEDLNYLKNNPNPNDPWYSRALDSLNTRIEKNSKLIEEYKNEPRYLSQDVDIPTGKRPWGVNINPGEWEGNVEDIVNKQYLRKIPGLEMNNTSAGIFSDDVVRRGTKAYDSINEYLKLFNLGRVKPGFNSQTKYSRGLWEDAIKSGKAVGYFNNPNTVYGSMKTIAPIIGGGLLYDYIYNNPTNLSKEQFGGSIELSNRMYAEGGPLINDPVSTPGVELNILGNLQAKEKQAEEELQKEQQRVEEARKKVIPIAREAIMNPAYRKEIFKTKLSDGFYCSTRSCELERAAGYTLPNDLTLFGKTNKAGSKIPVVPGTSSFDAVAPKMGFEEIPYSQAEPGDRVIEFHPEGNHSMIFAGFDKFSKTPNKPYFYYDSGNGKTFTYEDYPLDFNNGAYAKVYRYVGGTKNLKKNLDKTKQDISKIKNKRSIYEFEEGGEYELTNEEIQDLKNQGYDIELL